LNSPLIRGRLNFPDATHGVRNYTGPLALALSINRGDTQGCIAIDAIRVVARAPHAKFVSSAAP
jgi:hypothetical protein